MPDLLKRLLGLDLADEATVPFVLEPTSLLSSGCNELAASATRRLDRLADPGDVTVAGDPYRG
jgi:hypothetical protein